MSLQGEILLSCQSPVVSSIPLSTSRLVGSTVTNGLRVTILCKSGGH